MTSLNNYSVIADLKLTEEQLDKIDELFQKWADLFPALSGVGVKLDRETAEFGKAAKVVLTPEQQARHAELVLRVGIERRGAVSVFEHPPVAAAVGVTAEQKAKLAEVRSARRKELLALFLTGDPVETIKARVKEHEEKTAGVLAALVTAEQREKLAALTGKPVPAGFFDRLGVPHLPTDDPPAPPKGHLATYAAMHAAGPFAQKSIKADAEQVKKLTAVAAEFGIDRNWLRPPVGTDEERRTRAAELDRRLADILTPNQLAALRRLAFQSLPLIGNVNLPVSRELLSLDATAETLKLTPAQTRLIRRGAYFAEVLTPPQLRAWEAVAGRPRPSPGRRGRCSPPRSRRTRSPA